MMARSDPYDDVTISQTPRVPLKPEGTFKRRIFRFLGIGTTRKPPHSNTKDITLPPEEKRRKSRILGFGGDHNRGDAERLQHVRESKVRQPLDTGDAGSINFSTTSLQNSERTGGGQGGAVSPIITSGSGAGGLETSQSESPAVDNELGQFDSATTSNTSNHSPLDTAQSGKPPSTLSQNTAATSFSHVPRPISATPIMLPPHSPASPIAPSTSSLYPRVTDDASVLTLASSSKHIRRRNSFDTNASMLAIAPSSRRDSQESMEDIDSSEVSISGARRSVGSALSSKIEGGRVSRTATGHSDKMGEEDEDGVVDKDEGEEEVER